MYVRSYGRITPCLRNFLVPKEIHTARCPSACAYASGSSNGGTYKTVRHELIGMKWGIETLNVLYAQFLKNVEACDIFQGMRSYSATSLLCVSELPALRMAVISLWDLVRSESFFFFLAFFYWGGSHRQSRWQGSVWVSQWARCSCRVVIFVNDLPCIHKVHVGTVYGKLQHWIGARSRGR